MFPEFTLLHHNPPTPTRYAKPISVARKLMEDPKLNMLVGSAATDYARKHGFTMEDNDALLSEDTRKAYQVSHIQALRIVSPWLVLTFLSWCPGVQSDGCHAFSSRQGHCR